MDKRVSKYYIRRIFFKTKIIKITKAYIVGMLEGCQGLVIAAGIMTYVSIGLASWKQVPLTIQVANYKPLNLCFSTKLGLTLLILVGICIISLTRELYQSFKKASERRKKNEG